MKAYAAKSSAKRAALKQLSEAEGLSPEVIAELEGKLWSIEEHPEGGFFWRRQESSCGLKPPSIEPEAPVAPPSGLSPKRRMLAAIKMRRTSEPELKEPVATLDGKRRASEIESPVAAVWEIAERMYRDAQASDTKLRRKEVIAACEKAGIAFYTARTQYQRWYSAAKNSGYQL